MQFQILGPLRVTAADEREIPLGGAKPAAVLAMLLLRPNELVSADQLIEDLWDGQPPATAAKTLQVHMSRLRHALGEGHNGASRSTITTTRGGYLLDVESDQVDALRFRALVAEGTAALSEGAHARASTGLRAALALWRGEALADFRYASFAQDAIARLDGLRTVALESALEAELALGRHAELIPELKALVKRHPLSEHLRAQLMLALYRSGRQAEALGVYRAGRRLLVDNLGIEPGEKLRELEGAILAQDPQLAPPAPQPRERRERAEQAQRGTLVGYERELGALEDVLEQALGGQGGLALIAGEPGVGKTRLADELASVADTRGAQVVWGRCWSGGGAPAYWPWIQVLRALVADSDPLTVRAELGSNAAELAQLLPELRDLIPGLEPADHRDPEDARFRLFDAAAGFILRTAATRPLVIVLDDLHAADDSTLSLLRFMAGAALDAPVLTVATYRDTQADLERSLSETLSELARTADCLQLVLTGLSTDDTAHFVELSAGVAPMAALAAAIHETSEGNPLFVSELVRLLRSEERLHELEEGDALRLPRGLDQVIARRLEHLSATCRHTLSVAAVIGRDFDITLLERAADASGDLLLGQIDDAAAARVVEPVPGDGSAFRFSHDLVRHSLYAGLNAVQRTRIHGAVALALEELHATRLEPVVAELAHHFSEALPAGDAGKAMRYLALAGDRAAKLAAPHEAASLYSRAADIGKANGADSDWLRELYMKLAEQLIDLSDLKRMKGALEEAEARPPAKPDPSWDARVGVARAHLAMLDASALDEDRIFESIALFEQLDDPLNASRAWSALVVLNCGRSNRLKGNEAAEQALVCAQRGGSRVLIGQAMRSIGSVMALGAAPVPEAIARVRALLDQTGDDAFTRARLMNCLASLENSHGRFDEARALIAQARATAPPTERANVESFLLSTSSRLELDAGNPVRAEEMARASCAALETQGFVRYLSSELMFLVDALIAQGKLDEALIHLERAAPMAAPDDADALLRQARSRALLELARGNVELAIESARVSLAHAENAYAPDELAECHLVLGRALLAAGRASDAHTEAAEALRVSEERQNVVLAQRARAMLAPAARPVAMSR